MTILAGLRRWLTSAHGQEMAPEAFTELYAQRLRLVLPGHQVRVDGALRVAVHRPDGSERGLSFLENAWRACVGKTEQVREQVIERYVRSFLAVDNGDTYRSAELIVPLVRSRRVPVDLQTLCTQAAAETRIQEDLNDELAVVYVYDTPHNAICVPREDLQPLGLAATDLRAMAVRNLRALLPAIEFHRGDMLNMVTAGGSYEASLLLLTDLWQRERADMQGDPVVAIPVRDLLVFVDSANPDAVAALRELAADFHREGEHPLTPSLFVIRGHEIRHWH